MIVIMYFQIKVRKRFVGDILYIVILDFSADRLTLSVKIWCPGLVHEKLWSASASGRLALRPQQEKCYLSPGVTVPGKLPGKVNRETVV